MTLKSELRSLTFEERLNELLDTGWELQEAKDGHLVMHKGAHHKLVKLPTGLVRFDELRIVRDSAVALVNDLNSLCTTGNL